MHVLVTGCGGFIGYHLARALLEQGSTVTGVDSLNDYYDVGLKRARLQQLEGRAGFTFQQLDLCSRERVAGLFASGRFDVVAHLAAQAGVRYSLDAPHAYVDNNVAAFLNVLEGCRHHAPKHLVFASSSSVYGDRQRLPLSVQDQADRPVSLYAATKLANEHMAHAYAHLFGIPTTGLRFFTVYGPWGRPDMAYFKFTKAIFEERPIDVYGDGASLRDFTYVDDVTQALQRLLGLPPAAGDSAPYRLHNIGNHSPVRLDRFIATLESVIGKQARKVAKPDQPGDVRATYADVTSLAAATGFAPSTPLEAGLGRFVAWYREYYRPA